MRDFEDDEMEFWLQVRCDDPRDRIDEKIQSLQELIASSNEVQPDDPGDRIDEIIQSLQELIASSNETDKASRVVKAKEYIKALKQQVEVCELQFSRYVAEGLGSLRFNTLS
jgi:DnaJ-domain-containing protein 1